MDSVGEKDREKHMLTRNDASDGFRTVLVEPDARGFVDMMSGLTVASR
jgi:hypothetical protein